MYSLPKWTGNINTVDTGENPHSQDFKTSNRLKIH